jgi:hypothetical protein
MRLEEKVDEQGIDLLPHRNRSCDTSSHDASVDSVDFLGRICAAASTEKVAWLSMF